MSNFISMIIVYLIVFFPIALLITLIIIKRNNDKNSIKITEEPKVIYHLNAENYQTKYQAKYLLTKNEWYEYKKLHNLALKYNLQICPKVRLADIIEPRKGTGEWQKLFYKIQAKHLDFLICDYNLRILAILELDDNSHNNTERIKRDQFVDQILSSVGYTVIRTRSITEELIASILYKPTAEQKTNNISLQE